MTLALSNMSLAHGDCCAGNYIVSSSLPEYHSLPATIGGFPYYVNVDKGTFIAHNESGGWVVASTAYLNSTFFAGGVYVGSLAGVAIHNNGGREDPASGWQPVYYESSAPWWLPCSGGTGTGSNTTASSGHGSSAGSASSSASASASGPPSGSPSGPPSGSGSGTP